MGVCVRVSNVCVRVGGMCVYVWGVCVCDVDACDVYVCACFDAQDVFYGRSASATTEEPRMRDPWRMPSSTLPHMAELTRSLSGGKQLHL